MAHEAQVRYSKLVDLKLRATLVKKVGVICNNRYEGSPKAGSVKVPVRDTEVAVNDYDKQTGAELTPPILPSTSTRTRPSMRSSTASTPPASPMIWWLTVWTVPVIRWRCRWIPTALRS